eukprot:gene40129-49633_t
MVLGSRIGSLSKYTAACAYFEEALEVNREDVDIWTLKCICHVRMGELTDAYEAINRVIKPNRPAPAEAFILRAKILWARGLTEQGNVDIRVAGSLDPHHPEVLSFAGRSFVKAEKLYKECLKAFTAEDVKLHIMLAKIYRLMGDLQSAYTSILKAKAIFEDASQCDYFNQSQFEQTELELDRAISHNPKVAEYFAVRGKARYYNGNFNKAFEDFKRVMELDP